MLDHPRKGFGYPIMKKANPRKGIVAVSSNVVTNMTPKVIGKNTVNYKAKQMAYPLNLYFVFLSAVITETMT